MYAIQILALLVAAATLTACDDSQTVTAPTAPERRGVEQVVDESGFVDETATKNNTPEVTQPTESVAKATTPIPTAAPTPVSQPAPARPVVRQDPSPAEPDRMAAQCANCGRVESISQRQVKGEGSGIGAAAGAVLGGILGHQFGSGKGKKAATAIGAIGGAVAGNEVEKRQKGSELSDVGVRMDSGEYRTITTEDTSGIMVGDRVRVVNGAIERF